jgi:uncharacterized protein DUF6178
MASDALARLLDTPQLARVVRQLPPEALHQLIRHHGLDACADLVAYATPEQLTAVFDLDLWRSASPGRDERLDTDRFAEWLEVLADTSATLAADTIAGMDEALAIAGLSQLIRVHDLATIAPEPGVDDAPPEPNATSAPVYECELAGYLVRGVHGDAWDAVVAMLHALAEHHPRRFTAVMHGCRRLSNSAPEVDGLDDLLKAPEQLLHDIAGDRNARRTQRGYTTPEEARAFLELARQRGRTAARDSAPPNPVAAAYFRDAHEAAVSHHPTSAPPARLESGATLDASAQAFEATQEALHLVAELLTESGVPLSPSQALLAGGGQPSSLARLRPLLEYVAHHDPVAFAARGAELAFLANTLVAGCTLQSRAFTPQEASEAAASVCNLALDHVPTPGETFLVAHELISVFETGWSMLHQVSILVAEGLAETLGTVQSGDPSLQRELRGLRMQLKKQRRAGKPWLVGGALEALAMLDTAAWNGVRGLLGECPVLPAAVPAILEGRASAVSATAFEFISTRVHIETIQRFMARLPDTLRG